MAHKYLTDIKVHSETEDCVPNTDKIDDDKERQARFEKERAKYGFDSRETWAMDYTLAAWIYERFMWYIDENHIPVNLEYHRIEATYIKKTKNGHYKQVTKEVTQLEAIKLVCNYMKYYMHHEYDGHANRACAQYEAALMTMSKLMHHMWW